jgi:hypothetical protein
MSYPTNEPRPVPSVETSQKFMAWNIKEMSESLKIISMALKNIDSNISILMRNRASPPQQQSQRQPKSQGYEDAPPF